MTNTDQGGRIRLAPVKDVPTIPGYQWLSESALRHLIFNSHPRVDSKGQPIPTNGLQEAGVIVRLGRKLLLDMDRFDAWLDSHRTSIPAE